MGHSNGKCGSKELDRCKGEGQGFSLTRKELLKILIREDARRSKLEIAGSGKALREALENIAFLSRKLESGV